MVFSIYILALVIPGIKPFYRYRLPNIGEYLFRNLVSILLYSLFVIRPKLSIVLIMLIRDWYSFSDSNCSLVTAYTPCFVFKSIFNVALMTTVFSNFVIVTFELFTTILANVDF